MQHLAALFLLIAISAAGSVRAADVSPVPPESDGLEQAVTPLIEELSSPNRQDRVHAERRLFDMGPAVLRYLPNPDSLTKASQREAVRRLRAGLELVQARNSLQPTTVAIDKPITLQKAVAKLAEAGGNHIRLEADDRLKQRVVTFSKPPQTFWSVVTRLEDECGLQTKVSDDEVMTLIAAKQPQKVVWSGESQSARISLVKISTKQLPGDGERLLLRLTWRIEFEPRFLPLFVKFRYDDAKLALADGTALAPFTPGASIEIPLSQSLEAARLQTDYILPRKRLGSEVSGELTFTALIAAGAETFRFESIAKGGARPIRHGGAVVTLESQRRRENSWRIPLRIVYDTGGPAFESHRGWFLQNRAELHCEGKTYVPQRLPDLRRRVDGAYELEYEFDNLPGDADEADLTYRLPTLITEMPIAVKEARFPAARVERDK